MTTLRAFTCDDLFRFNNIAGRGQPRGAVGRVGAARARWPVTLAEVRRSGSAGEMRSWAGHRAPAPRPGLTAEGGPGTAAYLAHWPEYFIVAEAPGGELMGYSKYSTTSTFLVMGKAEGSVAREEWHGHVTALSVAPEFRRLGLAAKLMELLEEISESSAAPSESVRGGTGGSPEPSKAESLLNRTDHSHYKNTTLERRVGSRETSSE
ncbi:hypothetical protein A6R68_23364 [Neotoma lepida]|uniref:N-alpha-acetyltransferase 20 n=1 Tax=Neotoma lepida TaxID=56216 RepID=A0A1A6HWM1_NEOLE|nr:hypothetical protein A6R68_23364 [Neotoma lepida]